MPFREDRDALDDRIATLERDLAVALRLSADAKATEQELHQLRKKLAELIKQNALLERRDRAARRVQVAVALASVAVVGSAIAFFHYAEAVDARAVEREARDGALATALARTQRERDDARRLLAEHETAAPRSSSREVGDDAPPLAAPDVDGHPFDHSRVSGRVLVVAFWATWCAPCSAEMAVLERFHDTLERDGLFVVGVAEDDDVERVRSFLGTRTVRFPIIHDARHAVVGEFGASTMPTTYVVDRRGVVRYVHRGYRSTDARTLEDEIRGLLAER